MITGIYLITSPTGRRYIGSSKNIERRFYDYRKLRCKSQRKLYNSLKKYGVESHKFEVIHYCEFEDLYYFERQFGQYYDVLGQNGLNCILPSFGDLPRIISDETKKKRSESLSGKNNPNYGKKHSQETRNKISQANKGNRNTLGIKHKDESKLNMSIAQKKYFNNGGVSVRKGKKNTKEHIDKYKQTVSKNGSHKMGKNSNAKKVKYKGIEYDCIKELWLNNFIDTIKYSTCVEKIRKGEIEVIFV